MDGISDVLNLRDRLDLLTALLIFIWALWRKHLVFGWAYREKCESEQRWQLAAINAGGMAKAWADAQAQLQRAEQR